MTGPNNEPGHLCPDQPQRAVCFSRPDRPSGTSLIPGLNEMRNQVRVELRIFHDAPQNLAFDKSGGVFDSRFGQGVIENFR